MASKPWFGIALLFWKRDIFRSLQQKSLYLWKALFLALLFSNICITYMFEMSTVGNCKSCKVFSVMDIILFLSFSETKLRRFPIKTSFQRVLCDRLIVKFYCSIIDKEKASRLINNRCLFMLIREMTSNVTVYLPHNIILWNSILIQNGRQF
jgi:hypothetical protein